MTSARARPRAAVLVLLLAAAAKAEPGAPAPSTEPLPVRAEPASLVLRRDGGAAVVIDAGTGSPPVVTASVGRIEDVRSLGDGRYLASYVPPREAYPQVAIVTALTADRFGWVSIPLVGSGLAIAHATPGASIQVSIGEARFGPVRANRRGEARVPVVVPPGVRFALHRGEPLDLQVPPTLHVVLAAARGALPADEPAEVPVVAVAVAADGSPRPGAPLEVSATQGELELAEVAPGAFAGRWRLPAGPPGVATATVRLRDEPGPATTASISRPVGAAARIQITGAPARVSADDEGPLRLGLRVTDSAGNPVAAAPVVATTFGTASSPAATGPGAWESALAFPAARGTVRRAAVTVRAAGLEERVEVEVLPGAPVRLEVEADVPTLVADGRAAARLQVRALDRHGNRVPLPVPRVAVTRGAAVSTVESAEGASWEVGYRPRRAREDGSELLSVRAGALESTARIAIVAPARRLAVSPKLGLAATTGGVRTPYLAAEASYLAPLLGGRLAFALEAGWLVHERTDLGVGRGAAGGPLAVEIHGRARYAPLLGTAWWRQPLGGGGFLWAGVGGGVGHVASEVSAAIQDPIVESGLAPVGHVSLALGRRFGHGAPFLEVRALRHASAGLASLEGALTVVSLSAGYRYDAY